MSRFYEEKDDSALEAIFKVFDRNGDGTVSGTELRTVMSSLLGQRASDEQINGMISEADTNNDGVIQLNELRTVLTKDRDGA